MAWVSFIYMDSDLCATQRSYVLTSVFEERKEQCGYHLGGRNKARALCLGNFWDVSFGEPKVGLLLNGLTRLFSSRYSPKGAPLKTPEDLKSFNVFDSTFRTSLGTKSGWDFLRGPEVQPVQVLTWYSHFLRRAHIYPFNCLTRGQVMQKQYAW